MKSFYPYTFGFFSGVLSVFDIGAALQKKNIISIAEGLNADIQRLSDDQNTLINDYKKTTDRVIQENFGDGIE